MKNYRRLLPGALLTGLAVAQSGLAHHAISGFDPQDQRTVRGTVTSFGWANPHTSIGIEPDTDPGTRLDFEGMSADFLGRRSWNRSTLQVGDRVEITHFAYRDGRPGGLAVRVRLADGTVKVMIDTD